MRISRWAYVDTEIKQKVQAEVANIPRILEDMRIKAGRTANWTT